MALKMHTHAHVRYIPSWISERTTTTPSAHIHTRKERERERQRHTGKSGDDDKNLLFDGFEAVYQRQAYSAISI